MLAEKLTGATDAQVGRKFNVTGRTVRNTMDWAAKNGLLDRYESEVLDRLVPKALAAYEKALDAGDTYVATEVLKGSGILKKPREHESQLNSQDEVLVWVRNRENKQLTHDISPTDASSDAHSRPARADFREHAPALEADFSAIDGESGLEDPAGDYGLPGDLPGVEELE